jgi:hypothetical protein
MVTGKLGWRLAGWFARSLPRHLLVPDGFSRARQERGLQSGAKNLLSLRTDCNEIDWGITRLEECLRGYNCAELILWTSRTGD